jgi:hypothetical protein
MQEIEKEDDSLLIEKPAAEWRVNAMPARAWCAMRGEQTQKTPGGRMI